MVFGKLNVKNVISVSTMAALVTLAGCDSEDILGSEPKPECVNASPTAGGGNFTNICGGKVTVKFESGGNATIAAGETKFIAGSGVFGVCDGSVKPTFVTSTTYNCS